MDNKLAKLLLLGNNCFNCNYIYNPISQENNYNYCRYKIDEYNHILICPKENVCEHWKSKQKVKWGESVIANH